MLALQVVSVSHALIGYLGQRIALKPAKVFEAKRQSIYSFLLCETAGALHLSPSRSPSRCSTVPRCPAPLSISIKARPEPAVKYIDGPVGQKVLWPAAAEKVLRLAAVRKVLEMTSIEKVLRPAMVKKVLQLALVKKVLELSPVKKVLEPTPSRTFTFP